jgi:hypothetical protein
LEGAVSGNATTRNAAAGYSCNSVLVDSAARLSNTPRGAVGIVGPTRASRNPGPAAIKTGGQTEIHVARKEVAAARARLADATIAVEFAGAGMLATKSASTTTNSIGTYAASEAQRCEIASV